MTTEHDFKAALQKFDEVVDLYCEAPSASASGLVDYEAGTTNAETIRFALRLADKLLGQEVSEGMWRSAMGLRNEDNDFDPDYDRVFKSMLNAAVKEIENDRTRSQF